MSWINDMLSGNDNNNGNNNKNKNIGDREYALELLQTSKNDISLLSKCVTEASNPELRRLFTNQLNASITDHFKLSDLLKSKGYYDATTAPSAQIKQEMQEAQSLQQNQNQQNQNQGQQNQNQ